MEYLLKKGLLRFSSGDIVKLDQIMDFMWDSLIDTEKQNFGKTFCAEVSAGKYRSLIQFDHKDSSNKAYYKVI